ncbi:MAG: hypothetical protein J5993_04820 [Clostridia bacterium]|nr:hypothetical protein [Clostridia bacterium]
MNFFVSLLCTLYFSGSITDVTKPYLSTYTCEYMALGEQNLLDEFERVTIELKKDGYVLRAKTKGGKYEREGTYTYCEETGEFATEYAVGMLENGELTFGRQIGDRYFFARFVGN